MGLFVVPGCDTAGQAVVLPWCSRLWSRSQHQVPVVAEVLAVALAAALAGCSRERFRGGQLQRHRALAAPAVTLEAFRMQKARQLATWSPGWIPWQAQLPSLALATKH